MPAVDRFVSRFTAGIVEVDDPRDVDTLIDLADQRMYLAKRANALTE
jgi:hypothetical protein